MAHQAPLPATDGGRQRSLALLHGVAGRFDVTVAVLHGWASPDPHAADKYLPGVTWLDLTGGRAAQLAAAPLLVAERRPPVLRHFSQPGQRRALRDLLTSGRFSAVVADTPYATGALPPRDPRASGQTSLIVNTHNVESEVWQAAAPDVSGGRLRLALDRSLVGKWELRALGQADGVAFCAQRDLDELAPRLRLGLTSAVVPNAVDTERLRALAPPPRATEALFVGSLRYAPNAEAARFLSGRLAPLFAAQGLTAVIAGGDGPSATDRGGQSTAGVRFAGRPDDLAPLYKQAFAAVVPIFSGSGTRLKVLEALAYARPVVASAKAVEGLGMTPEVHYLPAEDEATFAAQLGRLAADVRLRDELGRRGRALVEARYSWASAGAAFLALLAACGVRVADPAPRRRA